MSKEFLPDNHFFFFFFFWLEFAEEGLLHGDLQLLVPETEDDGAQEGSEDRVGDAHQGVYFQRLGTLGKAR